MVKAVDYDIKAWLIEQLNNSSDTEIRDLKLENKQASIIYISSVCESKSIHENIIKPFFQLKDLTQYTDYLLSFPECSQFIDRPSLLDQVLQGSICIFVDSRILLFNATRFMESSITNSQIEAVIQGPKDAMAEKLDTNLNLIRKRYQNKALTIEQQQICIEKRPIAILYDQTAVDANALNELKNHLEKLHSSTTLSVHEIYKVLMKEASPLFPTILMTDRPDRIIKNMGEGKVILIVEGSPFVLILPIVFFDFFSSMEDVYQLPYIRNFLIILRYIALFITLLLPSFYIGTTSYNTELLRFQLTMSIAGSRVSVPYSSVLELIFMLVMMELLSEASARLPKIVGSAATTVGGLILGQAASEAGLVSNYMVLIVSAVAITNFVIPISSMGLAIRVVKYFILLLTILFGMVGVVVGWIALLFYLANLRSFGKPYLQLFSVNRRD